MPFRSILPALAGLAVLLSTFVWAPPTGAQPISGRVVSHRLESAYHSRPDCGCPSIGRAF